MDKKIVLMIFKIVKASKYHILIKNQIINHILKINLYKFREDPHNSK